MGNRWVVISFFIISFGSVAFGQTINGNCSDSHSNRYERSYGIDIFDDGQMKMVRYTPSIGIGIWESNAANEEILSILFEEYSGWIKRQESSGFSIPPTEFRPTSDVSFETLVPVIQELQRVTRNHLITRLRVGQECRFNSILIPELLSEKQWLTRKPNPLALHIKIELNGNLELNGEEMGSVSDLTVIGKRLEEIFKSRIEYRVFRSGSNDIETTVYVSPDSTTLYGDIVKIFEVIAQAGSDPMYLVIDEQNTFPMPRIPRRSESNQ